MNSYHNYYTTRLYPIQDKVLKTLGDLKTTFYLTGGTALSRAFLNHRYSDDLDFFVNNDNSFTKQVEQSILALKSLEFHFELSISTDTNIRLFLSDKEVTLKVEFVNDVNYRSGAPIETDLFVRTDNVLNILSNKISALTRDEPKDIADIWQIAKRFPFSWKQIITEAKEKDMWVDEIEILKIVSAFDIRRLSSIRWVKEINIQQAQNDFKTLTTDLLWGTENSLCG